MTGTENTPAEISVSGAIAVGLMIPANNTTLEREMLQWLPTGSASRTTRIPRGKGLFTVETLPAYKAQALSLAAQYTKSAIDIVVYGCTAAGFIAGPDGDAALAEDLTRITSTPVVTVARSMVIALQEVGAKHIALVTPYSDTVNVQLKAFLNSGGISVESFNSFYAPTVDELGRIKSSEVAQLSRKTVTAKCDALFVACAQLPTYDILAELEHEFRRPVLSSNRAVTAQAMLVARRRKALERADV